MRASIAWVVVVGVAMADASLAAAARPGQTAFTASTVSNLRKEPDLKSDVVVQLAIGTELRVLEVQGSWTKVRTLQHEGWIGGYLVESERPTAAALLAKFQRARGKERLTYVQRAAALEPANLAIIEQLAEELLARGDRDGALKARRGWIAAKRRSLKWDGPLYPIERGIAHVPLGCGKEAEANSGRAIIPEEELRDRATFLTGSGKVVSVTTEVPFFEDDLALPFCTEGPCGPQLGYRLATKGRTGALAPSWLVAGHEIRAFAKKATEEGEPVTYEDTDGRVMLQLTDSGYWLLERDFSGWVAHGFAKFPAAVEGKVASVSPIAWLAEDQSGLRVLWRMEGGRECCASEVSVWLSRAVHVPGGKTTLENGEVYGGGHAETCTEKLFAGLPGEPRDVSEEHVLSDAFKYE